MRVDEKQAQWADVEVRVDVNNGVHNLDGELGEGDVARYRELAPAGNLFQARRRGE